VLIAQGRDASDVPTTQTFGPNTRCGPTRSCDDRSSSPESERNWTWQSADPTSAKCRYCSLIPGLDVKLCNDHPCRAFVWPDPGITPCCKTPKLIRQPSMLALTSDGNHEAAENDPAAWRVVRQPQHPSASCASPIRASAPRLGGRYGDGKCE
jgi:hypothetical protein